MENQHFVIVANKLFRWDSSFTFLLKWQSQYCDINQFLVILTNENFWWISLTNQFGIGMVTTMFLKQPLLGCNKHCFSSCYCSVIFEHVEFWHEHMVLSIRECSSTLYVGMPWKQNGRPIHCIAKPLSQNTLNKSK